ncbi:MAG: hypothetical protein ABWZ69_01625 [Mycetocola sp.]
MKRLTDLNVHVFVGDDFADAVLDFAAALARSTAAETLKFNAVDKKGKPKTVSFLLGPASSLVIESSDRGGNEPDNAEAFEFLRGRMSDHAIPRPASEPQADNAHEDIGAAP